MKYIFCAGCGRDITTSSNSEDWRVALMNQCIGPGDGQSGTDMNIEPHLESDKHFCNCKCLKKWVMESL